jgi:lysophospholipase L1-like esterase
MIFLMQASIAFAMGRFVEPEKTDKLAQVTQKEAIFTRYVALGDSITHGFQSGSVDETRQNSAYPCLLAKQMNTSFNVPLLKFPGFLVNIEDIGKGNIKWWQYYYPLIGGVRVDDFKDQSKINNFGVTGMTLSEVITSTGKDGGFYKLTLGPDGKPALDQALAKNPTFVSFWLGNNDVLNAALRVDASSLTDVNLFLDYFKTVESRLLATSSVQGVVVANVPDVTSIAYLDKVTNPVFTSGSYKPFWLKEALDNMIFTPDEIVLVRNKAKIINDRIKEVAAANGWAFVDANSIFNDIKQNGHPLKDANGNATSKVVNADYLGGIFSLDGVHPSITGHAVAANCMIDAINKAYGTNLKYVDEYSISQNDSLLKTPFDPRKNWIQDSWIGKAIYFVVDVFM